MDVGELRDFALVTGDAAWIARHTGTVDSEGRVHVRVPASTVTEGEAGGERVLMHVFADRPRDHAAGPVTCPARWVS